MTPLFLFLFLLLPLSFAFRVSPLSRPLFALQSTISRSSDSDQKIRTLQKHSEIINSFPTVVESAVNEVLLETGEKSWQPVDLLPYPPPKGFEEQMGGVSDELLIVLIGDMITEEALPTYQTLLNTFVGCEDTNGSTQTPWAKWSRGWTSEENRHGDLLNRFLYLNSDRVDMRRVECTVQHLITSGFNPGAEQDPYKGFIYTSFQERATKISHGNVGKLASKAGAETLARICAYIAGDEARHEKAYQSFCTEILDRDPSGFITSMGEVMRAGISMPAEQMYDGVNLNLYSDFSNVAQDIGVYTAFDYSEIARHLVKIWELETLEGLEGGAEEEREFLCKLPERYRKLAERSAKKKDKHQTNVSHTDAKVLRQQFKWIK